MGSGSRSLRSLGRNDTRQSLLKTTKRAPKEGRLDAFHSQIVSFAFLGFSPASAQEIQIGRGLICDTKEQVERFVALFAGNSAEAISKVNAEANKDNACAVAAVAFIQGRKASTARSLEGTFLVVEITVVGIVGPFGVERLPPISQFTVILINETGASR